jgi:ABC-type nitrate/sulfonate/bicarbonate transport system permease component
VRGLLPLATLLAAWQILGDDRSFSFPPPAKWLRSLAEMHEAGTLAPALAATLSTYVLALLVATLAGTGLGIAIGSTPRLDRALTPSLDALATLPGAAIIPVGVLLLGATPLTGVAIVALAIVWPILLNTAMAMRTVPAVRLEAARTLGLGPAARLTKVVLPSLTPAIVLGVRLASSMALVVTLLYDIVGAGEGVGRLLVEHQQRFDAAAAWGLLLVVGSLGALLAAGITGLEARVLRNRHERAG